MNLPSLIGVERTLWRAAGALLLLAIVIRLAVESPFTIVALVLWLASSLLLGKETRA